MDGIRTLAIFLACHAPLPHHHRMDLNQIKTNHADRLSMADRFFDGWPVCVCGLGRSTISSLLKFNTKYCRSTFSCYVIRLSNIYALTNYVHRIYHQKVLVKRRGFLNIRPQAKMQIQSLVHLACHLLEVSLTGFLHLGF